MAVMDFALTNSSLYGNSSSIPFFDISQTNSSIHANATSIKIVDGFSVTNRWLLYTSIMLAPAQFVSGLGSNCPSNIAFLAYNYYTQIVWHNAVRAKQLHALSLLPVHFNSIYIISYMGGISSGNVFLATILGFGTAGVLCLNTASAWLSLSTNLPDGYGVYRFFFFGWRTLSPNWRKLFLCWQIFDSLGCATMAISAIICAYAIAIDKDDWKSSFIPWRPNALTHIQNKKYAAIPLGAISMMMAAWPLILWTELIVAKNHIDSDTDMVAVWIFVAQVVFMILPNFGICDSMYED